MSSWLRQASIYISHVSDPWINLAFEDWLFQTQKQSKYQLMLYRNSPSVIIGRNQNPWRECNVLALNRDKVPIVRRKSGGGTVYHDMGNTNYSITMPRDEFDRKRNANLVSQALHRMDIPSEVNLRHDIVIGGKKVSGSAFKLVNQRAYHHGTMLISTDMSRLGLYLKGPEQGQIVGRGVESVKSQVTTLLDHSYTADHKSFCDAVAHEFMQEYSDAQVPHTILTLDDFYSSKPVQEIHEQLKSWAWTFGETSQFVHTVPLKESGKEISITVLEGLVVRIQLMVDGVALASQDDSFSKEWIGRKYDAVLPILMGSGM
ncbi:hypothetical protein BASA50_007622 [Batrachochytrium salamandrivorans]|uniref:Putative lipoate-protein ligase A n=1 Tax=Batrachochytrium salamandrivorans TaxID=1357716 RepID=A0ABQ8F6K2_9FUNG|nr:hypothetical protein BASA60_007599 [Batrachochytrium salamandrivorans]KAH6578124.1 hypothetical protein BASA62_000416 [Batrachochytrium salamandrivorans]KAH6582428.1 hypothetical protein BASA61_008537 [Batrachochytrium salamandrivorans]KAH6593102.1 hypothetical protein BASA50_007622 [Batrachochytrium salamandrivorans]KAH9276490.1 hypothetical protein BASA83_001193 [Batrachochytrium salamandrivorans]